MERRPSVLVAAAATAEVLDRSRREEDQADQAQVRQLWDRQGTSGLLPRDLTLREVTSLCTQVTKRESDRLPQSDAATRMARKRIPKNRTDALLRSGMRLEDVVKQVAMRILEQWVHILMRRIRSKDVVRTVVGIVHADHVQRRGFDKGAQPLEQRFIPMNLSSGFDSSGRLVLHPNPTPPAWTPLGSALRGLVPVDGQAQCEYVEDIVAALKLEDDFVPSSATHILRPNTAVRSELDRHQWHESMLDNHMKPDCMKRKDKADKIPAYNKAASKCAESPGPGTYKRPASSMRPTRSASYPSVGKLRTVAIAVMGYPGERFRQEMYENGATL